MEKQLTLLEELQWRGLVQDFVPGVDELFEKEKVNAYIGYDPTGPSLTIGHLVTVRLLVHLQRFGHRPVVLIGGATGMVGDPSGKSEERKFLDHEQLMHNVERIKGQLSKLLEYGEEDNGALMVNNYDWYRGMSVLSFLRDAGKFLTVNYMLAKDSVQKRLETGISFTEFSYQLIQAYDFYHLFTQFKCKLQMGGSDQWGNMTAGTELIRRKSGGDAYALTCPLLLREDGTKFGKSEGKNVWLDPELTSPYQFYQFWLNVSDNDAPRMLKIFTLLNQEEIEALEKEHAEAPGRRAMQKRLAQEVTTWIHGNDEYEQAVEASELLFGKGTLETLQKLPLHTMMAALEGVPQTVVSLGTIESGINVVELLADGNVFPSKGEARKMITGGGVSINKQKVESADLTVNADYLLHGRFMLVQKGKKNYYLLIAQ